MGLDVLDKVPRGEPVYIKQGDVYVEVAVYYPEHEEEIRKEVWRIAGRKYKYMSIFQKLEKEAIANLSKNAYLVLCWMRAHMKRNNFVRATVREVCSSIGSSPNTVSAAIKEIESRDYIKRHKGSLYLVNPSFGFLGTKTERARLSKRFYEGRDIRGQEDSERS
jgi:hypothetical protein